MAIVAGIDEAGYGPILGPLVVSGVAFEVPEESWPCDLWKELSRSISAGVSKRDPRLPIVDSKKLHHSQDGLAAVERTALVMLAAGGLPHRGLAEVLEHLCPQVRRLQQRYPWYRHFEPELPLACNPRVLRLKANAVSSDLRQRNIRFLGARCHVLPEGHFNDMLASTRNKSTVLWTLTLKLISRLLQAAGPRRLVIVVDRQGGRTSYAPLLLTAFEGADLEVLHEQPQRSAYILRPSGRDGSAVEVEFRQNAETHYLPVALASVFSKYLREVFMVALNRYWQDHIRGLKRTAGYYQDGKRFLKDIAPAVESLAIDPRMLVRQR